jgi:hypothetical protein
MAGMSMNEYHGGVDDRDLALALRRLDSAMVVPAADPARAAALLAAFDAAQRRRTAPPSGRQYWYMAALATAAVLLIAVGLNPALTGRHGPSPDARAMHKPQASLLRGVQPAPAPPGEFVMVPGAATLPAMESGSLVRIDVPVAMLPSLGLSPPQTNRTTSVTADLIVAQDGLPRAVRLVN